ncbi:hypothetical protein KsCSTR_49160 [Candidatus Kuenenia stuttgartiensis]|uniref:PilZ domain-containing protein n=1 Tax=Kuenenia stuttgartiensis TaxID=174633 RepID=Q1PVI4_KUEST|nr:PilZ domain-containing protein [Candidatus Kuenenia stuttgartiensis]MBE7546136.1 PilZ domain-containing protein [Planctomycetia bacterium]QII14293.1 hypothetical protein KsCSTR_49160 [Candidatus Kuenenia stuttgartiensis]GJQ50326.1 MAG: hypothetical protein HKUEN01_27120 [Candidatus Kuenenia stuttgartiensis]CAJ71234.1 unknown protein [Candidatus Kuenenia stuttgartiensis]
MVSLQEIIQLAQNIRLDNQPGDWKTVSKKHLINILNYIHFQSGTILINFKHLKYNNIISLQARPKPCLDDSFDCIWLRPKGLKLNAYEFLDIFLTEGEKLIRIKTDVMAIREEGIRFSLPDTCYELGHQRVKRYSCEGVQVDFIQNGTVFSGRLLDFGAVSFCVEVSTVPPQSFYWVNPECPVYIVFKDEQDTFYSGSCRIIRQTDGQKTRSFILESIDKQMRRFKPKKYRSSRHKLIPSPNIIFLHPLTSKMVNLEVEDLAGSGLSVKEYYYNSILLPGIIVPELFIEFADGFKLKCKAQVVYRNTARTKDSTMSVRCGIAFLDMDIHDQGRLSGILHHVANKKTYACNWVDLDALWKFFFETGFVYPGKYALMHNNKERFKETYEKLYIKNPGIARHFIYQSNGIIHGHISILRFYENTWLLHHHAASRSSDSMAGLVVLSQVERYINDFHRLYSTHMNYVICYFRPDNRFPHRVFGGVTESIHDPKGSSIDPFAYFHHHKNANQVEMSALWSLTKVQPEDLTELESFYEYTSGGLMIHALDLEQSMLDSDELSKEYQRLGFKRERRLFSLKKEGILKAFIMLNISDTGLNMSDLTNCIHIIVLESEDVPRDALYSCLYKLSNYYEQEKIPILLYPVSYAEEQSIPYDKVYNLWILNMQYTDQYFEFMEGLFSRVQKDRFKNSANFG